MWNAVWKHVFQDFVSCDPFPTPSFWFSNKISGRVTCGSGFKDLWCYSNFSVYFTLFALEITIYNHVRKFRFRFGSVWFGLSWQCSILSLWICSFYIKCFWLDRAEKGGKSTQMLLSSLTHDFKNNIIIFILKCTNAILIIYWATNIIQRKGWNGIFVAAETDIIIQEWKHVKG